MSDTIDLLERIGQNATLRHADTAELAATLEKENASASLLAAVASSDRSHLAEELGNKSNEPPQSTNFPGHEEEPDDDEDDSVEAPEHPTPDRRRNSPDRQ
ncbi:hypothetical protein ACQVBX_08095 [Dyella sp. KULCS107]|uniref:hypothetical protein n=1 Tax=Dyella sp. KULCS107 TaxID=3422216 RepID=UPI003D6F5C14